MGIVPSKRSSTFGMRSHNSSLAELSKQQSWNQYRRKEEHGKLWVPTLVIMIITGKKNIM